MSVHLHIERLVLEGLPVSGHQASLLQVAMEQELGRLMSAGRPDGLAAMGGAMPRIQGGSIQAPNIANPMQLGAQIAASVYSGIGARK